MDSCLPNCKEMREASGLYHEIGWNVEDSTMRCSILGLIVTLTLSVLVTPLAVDAQAPVKAARIGWLRSAPETPEVRRNLDTFLQALRDQGYSVGQNVTFVMRSPTERTTPLSALMGELLQFQADVIVAGGPAAVDAA